MPMTARLQLAPVLVKDGDVLVHWWELDGEEVALVTGRTVTAVESDRRKDIVKIDTDQGRVVTRGRWSVFVERTMPTEAEMRERRAARRHRRR